MVAASQSPAFQIVYVSSASDLLDEPSLKRMLSDIRAKNAAQNITGILLYADGNIMQVLEGEQTLVEQLMQAIISDPRHKGVIVLLRQPIPQRQFAQWSMAYKDVSDEPALGFSNFLQTPCSEHEFQLQAGRAKSLLLQFRSSMT